jgi:hypothetical protein
LALDSAAQFPPNPVPLVSEIVAAKHDSLARMTLDDATDQLLSIWSALRLALPLPFPLELGFQRPEKAVEDAEKEEE